MSQAARESLSDAEDEAWDAAVEILCQIASDDNCDWSKVSDAAAQALSAGRKGNACAWKLEGDES